MQRSVRKSKLFSFYDIYIFFKYKVRIVSLIPVTFNPDNFSGIKEFRSRATYLTSFTEHATGPAAVLY